MGSIEKRRLVGVGVTSEKPRRVGGEAQARMSDLSATSMSFAVNSTLNTNDAATAA